MADEQELIKQIRARRAAGIPDLGAEIRRRVADFGAVKINSDLRREAFSELTAPFEVAPYRLIVSGNSYIDPDDQVVALEMGLVEQTEQGGVSYVGAIERTYLLGEGRVLHQRLEIDEQFRGRAIAPRIILASFERYDRLGIDTVIVHAALATGRYYWSGKVGFDFLREADQRYVERWATFVLGALNLPIDLDGISQPQQWALLGTTVDPPPTARFSDFAGKVSKVSASLLDPGGGGSVGSVERAEVESEEGMVDVAKHLRNVADANHIGWDDPIPLGKLIMLSGPDWWGRFDLTDPVSRGSYQANAERAIAKAQRSSSP
jgi:hypothetical protein